MTPCASIKLQNLYRRVPFYVVRGSAIILCKGALVLVSQPAIGRRLGTIQLRRYTRPCRKAGSDRTYDMKGYIAFPLWECLAYLLLAAARGIGPRYGTAPNRR